MRVRGHDLIGPARRMLRCVRGSAAVEFALGFTLILMPIMLGGVELYLFSAASRSVVSAAGGMARVAAGQAELGVRDFRDRLFPAMDAILGVGNYEARLTHIVIDSALNPPAFRVLFCAQNAAWSQSVPYDLTEWNVDDPLDNTDPVDVSIAIIIAEVAVNYNSPIAGLIVGERRLAREAAVTPYLLLPVRTRDIGECSTVS